MNPALSYLYSRLSEPSTWRGIIALVTAAGVALSPDQVDKIIAAGLALIGLIGAFMPDKLARRASEGRLAIIALAVLTVGADSVQAQYLLPFRNNHEQRLKALEQKIAQTPQQQAPAPQQTPAPQPIIIQVPAQPAAPSTPPQIVYPYPAQPPLQTFPIQGQPLQTFPIQGQPLQTFPIQGSPQQTFPIQGQPLQPLPIGGQPKQAFPIGPPQQSNPPAPSPPPQANPPQPAPSPTPAAPGAPLQTFPVAPKAPQQPAPSPAPSTPAPSSGPVPYSTRFITALYSDQRSALSDQPNRPPKADR